MVTDYEREIQRQAEKDNTLIYYIKSGQTQKALNRLWEIAQQVASFISNVANIVDKVWRILNGKW